MRETIMRALTIAFVSAVLSLPALSTGALADEKPIELKKAPGLDKVEGNCGSCHSLDYIQMNSPFMSPATWDAEVTKMIKAFGAPISDADAAAIKEYLKANYGG
jgi:mono/diheme cytochrome c family protein